MPKIGFIDKYLTYNKDRQTRKPFLKSVEKLCPTCKMIHSGPDKGSRVEPNTGDLQGELKPMTYHGHRISYETCKDCKDKGISEYA